jgi:2-keto-4-pentenoate hydratase/2-oxohepta-3-ene-1,7-dioic acid hydratase in catechol pathway
MSYRLMTLDLAGGSQAAIAVEGGAWPLSLGDRSDRRFGAPSLMDVLGEWEAERPRLERLAATLAAGGAGAAPIADPLAHAGTPLRYPAKVICTMANYYDHLEEMGIRDYDKTTTPPLFFLRPPTTTLVGPGPSVRMPPATAKLDWEIELAAIIVLRASGVAPAEALALVACYAIALDLTARDLQLKPDTAFRYDFFAGKCCDTTCPLGPALVPAAALGDPRDLALELTVNGETMQRSNTRRMIYSVGELVAAASRVTTLEPGDVILTGTPAGVGHARGRYLKRGDRLVATIERMGELAVVIQ